MKHSSTAIAEFSTSTGIAVRVWVPLACEARRDPPYHGVHRCRPLGMFERAGTFGEFCAGRRDLLAALPKLFGLCRPAGSRPRDRGRGVKGLLPGSGDPADLNPVRAGDGKRYFVYKAFLAVSAVAAPFATVSIIRPAGATLFYGSSSRIGALFSPSSGQALIAASRTKVRLPVCGPQFTGFVGGIIVTGPTCVTFEVSSPSMRPQTVSVPIGSSDCRTGSAARH